MQPWPRSKPQEWVESGPLRWCTEKAADDFDFAEKLEELNEELKSSTARHGNWKNGLARMLRSCWRGKDEFFKMATCYN